ncbi:kinase-like domain-containing protein [Globomyces pollinis-pini]|nr:kinase-like domain-containing protein [Globomyces pollinis-pini]KAJ3000201.1 hypothetical protein HDV02_000114 [Globomyces sp. JEL0801]
MPEETKAEPKKLAACEYKTGKTLGKGSYGTVKEAIKIATKEHFAIKLISKSLMRGKESLVINEINILKKISKGHKNIVTLHDYFESPNNLYLVMDLCTGGELFDRICDRGNFFEHDAAEIVWLVVDALDYLHQRQIVHRDIKPENLLFKNREEASDIVIADFGLSKFLEEGDEERLRTTCGTPGYMAPEILNKTGYGKPVDMWAVGVMAYFLLCGYMPFESHGNNAKELDNVLRAKFQFDSKYWKDVSENAKDFISNLLLLDTTKRLTAKQAKQHPWLQIQRKKNEAAINLLPQCQSGFNAKKTFKKAIGMVKAVNKLSHSNLAKSASQEFNRLQNAEKSTSSSSLFGSSDKIDAVPNSRSFNNVADLSRSTSNLHLTVSK